MALPTIALTWNSFVQQLAALAAVQTQTVNGIVVGLNVDNWDTITPQACNYAELRIQRDLELLPQESSNSVYSLSSGVNILALPVSDFMTVQTVALQANDGTVTALLPTTKEFIQNVYPGPAVTGPPAYFAMYGGDWSTSGQTSNIILVGPYTDQVYTVQITGLTYMPTLYLQATMANAATGLTFISTYLPDVMLAAAMCYVSAFQRDFGRQSDDPQFAQSWEAQYQTLIKGAMTNEFRKRLEAAGWSSRLPSPVATPGR